MAGKRLTKNDIDSLTSMVLEKGMSDQEIADVLGCNRETVARHRKNKGLIKTGGGVLKPLIKKPDEVTDDYEELGDKTQAEQETHWRTVIRSSNRYPKLKDMFMPHELLEFEDKCIEYYIQMDDLTPTEQDMIELLIILKMRIDQNQKDYRKAQEIQLEYEEQIGTGVLDLDNTEHLQIYEMSISNSQNMIALNKDNKDLIEKVEKIQRAMNQTREQREKSKNVGQDTFFKLVKAMQSKRQRQESGSYTEKMKEATDQALIKMKKPHKFVNGVSEPIYLDGEDFKKDKNNE